MRKKPREFHDNDSENISGESIGGAPLIDFFVPDAALIRVNTVCGTFKENTLLIRDIQGKNQDNK